MRHPVQEPDCWWDEPRSVNALPRSADSEAHCSSETGIRHQARARNSDRIHVFRVCRRHGRELPGREVPAVHPAILRPHQNRAVRLVECNWAESVELPIFCQPRYKLPGTRVPEPGPMTRIGDASFIRSKRDLAINSGAADVEPRGSGACVEELDYAGPGDDQNGLSVVAETNRTVVPAIGTKEPRRSRLFQRVEAQIFAGNGKQALVGAELEIVQRTPAKRD